MMRTNWNDTNNAFRYESVFLNYYLSKKYFRERVAETQSVQMKISDHLKNVDREIVNMKKELKRLKTSHHDKLAPVKLNQTRLERRSHRPDNEACTDSPHQR